MGFCYLFQFLLLLSLGSVDELNLFKKNFLFLLIAKICLLHAK